MRAPRLLPTAALLTFLALSASSAPLRAQDAAGPRVLTLPASTRAMALGDAFMPGTGGSEALFYHPALLLDAEGFGLQLQSWSGEGTSAQASAAGDWFGGDVGVGVGVQTLQYSVGTDQPGSVPTASDPLFSGGLPVSERVATLGLAREIWSVQVGVAGKVVEQRLAGGRDATVGVDLGIAKEVGPFQAALSAQNLGPEMRFAGGELALPRRYTLGVGAYGREVGPLDVGLAASLRYEEAAEELVPSAGLEVGYWPVRGRTFVGRVGVQRVPTGDASPLSLGFAFWGDDLALEWAWQPFGGDVDEGTHRFGVGWR